MWKKNTWILLTLAIWAGMIYVNWVGYAGADDMFYTRYAFKFDRPPINHWEFRIPAIMAIRASFFVFGTTEFAACVPTILASGIILLCVAWFVGWPRRLTWQTQSSMLLASVVPLNATMASYPAAPLMAAAWLALGTVCLLKGTARIQILGAACLAIGFSTHEVSFFYVAIFCLTAIAFDWQRFWRPVVACMMLSIGLLLAESIVYQTLLDEPLARFVTAAQETAKPIDYGRRFGDSKFLFFVWPVKFLFFSKHFGFDLIIILVLGVIVWKRLDTQQKILFATMFIFWFWLGYGTQVPWAYKPRSRAIHYYFPLVLVLAVVLPPVLQHAFARRHRIAQGGIVFALAVHIVCSGVGGRWGQRVEVSRELLQYAKDHSDQVFLTDVHTMNEIYVINRFQLPDNVICLNGPAVENHLLVNKEPPGPPRFRFPNRPINGILINHERIENLPEKQFSDFVQRQNEKKEVWRFPVRYKPIFTLLPMFVGRREIAVKSLGGKVVQITNSGLTQLVNTPPP